MQIFQHNRAMKDNDKRVICANVYRINYFKEVHFSKACTKCGLVNQQSYNLVCNRALYAVFLSETIPFTDIIN